MRNRATWLEIIIMVAVTLGLLVFFGCAQPASPAESKPGVVVKNSTWQTVTTSLGRGARAIDGADLVAYVEEYNETHIDDFLRIYEGENVPSLDDAPDVSVYVCNPSNYHVNSKWENIPRRQLVENAEAWRAGFRGQLLFIDHVPPPPIITPPPSMYAHYAIYLVDNATGAIILEEHCGYLPDETFDGQFIFDGGWTSVDDYYQDYLYAYTLQAQPTANNCHVVTRQLYAAP